MDISQEELKKQEEFENESVHLSGQVRELESKMESEVANHQKAKEGKCCTRYCPAVTLNSFCESRIISVTPPSLRVLLFVRVSVGY